MLPPGGRFGSARFSGKPSAIVQRPTRWKSRRNGGFKSRANGLMHAAMSPCDTSLRPWPPLSGRQIRYFIRCSFESVPCGAARCRLKLRRLRGSQWQCRPIAGGAASSDVVDRRNRYQVLRTQCPARHGACLTARFDGEVSKIGLESFLGAIAEGEHWLLLLDLDGSLLPFRQMRVRSSDLRAGRCPESAC